MPATEHWKESAESRAKMLESRGVFWYHDGNPKRPYVRLRSGLISNGYFNGAVLGEYPVLLNTFAAELVGEYIAQRGTGRIVHRVVGPAMGAITLAHAVAAKYFAEEKSAANIRMSFAEKDGDGFALKRSKPQDGERVLLVEDTVTTGGSVLKVRNAVLDAAKVTIEPYLLALCNRSGSKTLDGMEIISLVDGDFKTWKEGENPFTGGPELVPVVENAKDNWGLLTQAYA
jgi:orotate phosphoribosyltransferase